MTTKNPASTSVRTTSWVLALVAAACLASGTALAASLGGFESSSAAAQLRPVPVVPATPTPSHSAITPTPSPSHSVVPTPKPTPSKPSEAIKLLQRELGQLNYYEGAVTGYNTPATVAAVKDLQRDAQLPRTGALDAATEAALINFLVNGNSQMGR